MKIEPRKESNKGGYLCMPLYKNVPEGKLGWKKIHCPICGEMCWWRPENIGVMYHSKLDGAACTQCAIRKAAKLVFPKQSSGIASYNIGFNDGDETRFDVRNLS